MKKDEGLKLKELKCQREKLDDKLKDIIAQKRVLGKEENTLYNKIKNLTDAINKLTEDNELTISDHSIIQYMNRVLKIDIEQIKKDMIDDNIRKQVETLGDGNYPNKNFILKIRHNNIITVLLKEEQ